MTLCSDGTRAHHWIIQAGDVQWGRCRKCGKERVFEPEVDLSGQDYWRSLRIDLPEDKELALLIARQQWEV